MTFGRIERTPRGQPISDINVTPLVDVMLVLLVIFLLTAPLLAPALKLDLPRAGSTEPPAAASVLLEIDAAGQILLEGQPLQADQVAPRLAQLARARPDAELQLRADQSLPYGQVLALMGQAREAGLSRLAFVAAPPSASPGR